MADDRPIYDAWLAAGELPYSDLIPLLHTLNGSVNVYRAFLDRDPELEGMIPDSCRKILAKFAAPDKLEEIRKSMEQHRIRTMTILDPEYPHKLRQIPDPAGILFVQGDTDCLRREKIAAMVGSRKASYAGLKAARKTAADLSRRGVTIISGLAYGIDAECHWGCLEGGSPTVAVMGCGLDQTYPSENEALKNTILQKGGLILSEYAPGSKPLAFHFPVRNRIISGLADAVILIEARIRSGSLTTIGHALHQGREVFSYPGDPVSPYSEGNRILLREGARYFTTAEDVLEDMQWLDILPHVGQNSVCSSRGGPSGTKEAAVCEALERGILGFDELAQITGLSASDLMSTLTVLQIRKVIDLLPGKKYQIRQE